MHILLVLPNQLFEQKYFPKQITHVYVHEHSHYFNDYKYNKKKLMLHKASISYYKDYISNKYKLLSEMPKEYVMFASANKHNLKPVKVLDNPNFLLTKKDYDAYQKKTKSYKFYPFYMHFKKQLNILPNEKSYDKQNRGKLSKDVERPKQPSNKADGKWIKGAISEVNKTYKSNPGTTEDFIFPVTHKTAKRWLKHFINHKLSNFGKYQDAIDSNDPLLFHSLLAPAMNIGLLNPKDIITAILKKKSKVAMNNIEGFIRQLFWREYQLYCYIYVDFDVSYFNNKKKLTKDWYYGTLGVYPVDDAIKRAFDTGYLHHIERLMVIGNYMNLMGINEKECYRWFMEFSCDSYEWVMHQNVLDMVFFVTGGKTTRRPYVSSSNYIKKMSNYKKGDWEEKWDELYENFKTKQNNKLQKFRYFFRGL